MSAVVAALLLLVAAQAPAAPAGAAGRMLVSASSDEHLWFVQPLKGGNRPWVLRHHAASSDGAVFTAGLALPEAPERLAASGDRVWLLNAPQRAGESWRRAAFTIAVRHNPAFDTFYYDPPDRLGIEAPLDGPGLLRGFIGTPDGPVALLVPEDGSAARLVRLESGTWVEIALPQGFSATGGDGRDGRLVAGAQGGTELIVLADGGGGATAAWWLQPGEAWRRLDPEPHLGGRPWSLADVVAETRVDAAAALVLQATDGGGERAGDAEIAYLRPRQLLPLARVPIGGEAWTILGVRDGLRVIEQAGDGSLSMRRVDVTTGAAGPAEAMTGQQLAAGPVVHLLLVLATAVGVLLVLFLVRGSPKPGTVALPPSLEPLPMLLRLAGGAIDVGVGAAAAIALLRAAPSDLALLPMWTPRLADATPALVTIGLTVAHTVALELLIHRSLGKLLVGARVVAARDGGRTHPLAILARNAGKALLLLVPVLVVVMILSPSRQGIDDLLGRTMVVRRAPLPGRSDPSKDR